MEGFAVIGNFVTKDDILKLTDKLSDIDIVKENSEQLPIIKRHLVTIMKALNIDGACKCNDCTPPVAPAVSIEGPIVVKLVENQAIGHEQICDLQILKTKKAPLKIVKNEKCTAKSNDSISPPLLSKVSNNVVEPPQGVKRERFAEFFNHRLVEPDSPEHAQPVVPAPAAVIEVTIPQKDCLFGVQEVTMDSDEPLVRDQPLAVDNSALVKLYAKCFNNSIISNARARAPYSVDELQLFFESYVNYGLKNAARSFYMTPNQFNDKIKSFKKMKNISFSHHKRLSLEEKKNVYESYLKFGVDETMKYYGFANASSVHYHVASYKKLMQQQQTSPSCSKKY